MIELNKHALAASKIADQRTLKEGIRSDTMGIFIHLSEEVIEAVDAYNSYLHSKNAAPDDNLAGELADVITCCLIIADHCSIDIEKALTECQKKNYRRAYEQPGKENR